MKGVITVDVDTDVETDVKTDVEPDEQQGSDLPAVADSPAERSSYETQVDSSGDPVVRYPEPRLEPDYIHSPFQEWLNAATMAIPTLVCVFYLIFEENTVWLRILTAGIVLHLPFSVAYHIGCAQRAFKNEDETEFLQLDQTFIHVTACFIALATSGSPLYAIQNTIANTCFIVTLWRYHPLDRLRQMNVFAAVVMYTLPLLLRQDYVNFFGAWVCFICSVLSLKLGKFNTPVPLLYGWGHIIFHLWMGPFAWFILKGVSGTTAAVDEGNSRWYV